MIAYMEFIIFTLLPSFEGDGELVSDTVCAKQEISCNTHLPRHLLSKTHAGGSDMDIHMPVNNSPSNLFWLSLLKQSSSSPGEIAGIGIISV